MEVLLYKISEYGASAKGCYDILKLNKFEKISKR